MSHISGCLRSLTRGTGHSKNLTEATQAIDVFKGMKEQIKQAEDAVGRHVDFWAQRSEAIEGALLDPQRLFDTTRAPKVAIVKKQCQEWKNIQHAFDEYGAQVRRSAFHLRIAT